MKKCNQCLKTKSYTKFSKKSSSKDGYYHTCKPCKSLIDKEYRDKNKTKLSEKAKQYHIKNAKHRCEMEKQRRLNRTPEEMEIERIRKREYTQSAPEAVKQRKREYDKAYFASSDGKKVTALSAKKRRAQKLSSEDGTITYQSLDQLMEDQEGKCKYCHTELNLLPKGDTHLDHVIPLSKGGIHSITNVVWSCAPCNHKKSDKLI